MQQNGEVWVFAEQEWDTLHEIGIELLTGGSANRRDCRSGQSGAINSLRMGISGRMGFCNRPLWGNSASTAHRSAWEGVCIESSLLAAASLRAAL